MPIVSEHPRSLDIIEKLADECNADLESFVREYLARRKQYRQSAEARKDVVDKLDDDERDAMEWRDLVDLLEAREAASEELRDELELMSRELTLLKREMRRARRKLMEAGSFEGEDLEAEAQSTLIPQMPSLNDYFQRARERGMWNWLKPWLRGFLPGAA